MPKEVDYSKREIVWIGSYNHRKFRIVDLGPVRPDKNDTRFAIEEYQEKDLLGHDRWKSLQGADSSRLHETIRALVGALGLVMVYPIMGLIHDHRVFCEMNMAKIENRVAKGCDCVSKKQGGLNQ